MKTIKVKDSCGGQGCNTPNHTKLTGYDYKVNQPRSKRNCVCGKTKNADGTCDGSHNE